MALTTTSSVYTYTANGSQRVFTFPYKFTRRTDIRVTLIENGVERDLVLGADYNVDPDGGDSATVTLTTAPAAGVLVRIRRVVGLTQPQTFPIQGPFDPKAVEAALDRIHMILQQLSDGLGFYVHGKEGGGDLHALATETEAGFLGPEDYAWMKGHQSSGASHTIDQIVGLPDELDRLTVDVGGKAPLVHVHPISDITGLPTELDRLAVDISQRAPVIHSHTWDQITEKPNLYTREEVDGLLEALTPADIGAAPAEEIDRLDKRIDDLVVPHIGTNKNWWIAGVDTGIRAEGVDGITPHIGENRNWWIGTTDTGVRAEGVDGSKWFSATGAPSEDLGSVGDFYLDAATGNFYEKTGTSTWTLRGNLKGPKGDSGDNGLTPELRRGVDAIEWRYQGAPNWSPLVPLVDIAGPQGPEGPQGPPGEDGTKWYLGESAPSGSLGKVGDLFLVSTTGDYYEKTDPSTWVLQGNLKGPKGDKGDPGNGGGGSGIIGIATYQWDESTQVYDLRDFRGDNVFPISVDKFEIWWSLAFDNMPDYHTYFAIEAEPIGLEAWITQKDAEYPGLVLFRFFPYMPGEAPGSLPERPETFRVTVFRGPE